MMGNKNGFDPGITSGVQFYWERKERIVVVHPGGYLNNIENGRYVLFETKPSRNGTRLYWFGTVSPSTFYFVLGEAKPIDIIAVGSWFAAQHAMLDAHGGVIDEFNDMQGELPF
ncbi:MAG: hypothetical protein K0S95_739 [Pantoea eucrina]|jgi:hypothetical protein|nr:hypothetical protein [Pantoea eucrina]